MKNAIKAIIALLIIVGCSIYIASKIHYVNYYNNKINEVVANNYKESYFNLLHIPLTNYNDMVKQADFNFTTTITDEYYYQPNAIKYDRMNITLGDNNYSYEEVQRGKSANTIFYKVYNKNDPQNYYIFRIGTCDESSDEFNPNNTLARSITQIKYQYDKNNDANLEDSLSIIPQILKDNNINTDQELNDFLKKKTKNTIFTPFSKMEENYVIQYLTTYEAEYLVLIEGNNYGILFSSPSYTGTEIYIANNNNVYFIYVSNIYVSNNNSSEEYSVNNSVDIAQKIIHGIRFE